jgi:glycolate oxidase FAD binding subunit
MATSAERLADRLRRAVPGLAVATAAGDGALAVDGLAARALAAPESEEELAAALALASAEGWHVHVRGSGGQEEAAEPIRAVDLVLSLARLSGVTEHAPEDLTVGAWAGTPLDALADALGQRGQRLPGAPVAAHATLGGLVATGRSGPFRLGYRTPRDSVLGLRICLADGTLLRTGGRVVKNVAGYDLTRLLVGSLGTLAVVTQAFVRVAPLAPARASLWLPGDDPGGARERLRAWQDRHLEPVAFEHLDGGAAAAVGVGAGQGALAAFEDEPASVAAQVAEARKSSSADLEKLLKGPETWTVTA